MKLRIAIFWAAAIGLALSLVGPAAAESAAQERREACSKEWNAAKEAGKVPEGQTWAKFYSECNARLKAAEEGAAGAKPAATAADKKASDTKAAAKPAEAKPAEEESTRQSRMKQCSAEWQAAKDAGKVPAGQTWPKFYSECNARLTGAAPAAAPAAATAAKPAAAPAKPAAAPAATAAASGKSRQQQCAEEWKTAKEAGKVPADQTWPKFYSECNARLSGEAPAATPATAAKPATATPAKPAAAPAAAAKPATAKVEDDEDTGEGVREPTPGQLAARQRMKDCGAEWRATKEAGKIPEGQTWPQYWSACNKRLKAAGK